MENAKSKIFKPLRAILWLCVIIALGFALFQIYSRASHSINANPLERYKQGTFSALEFLKEPPKVENITFLDKNGKIIGLKDINAKIKVVNIWATWCPPCVREMPELASFAQKFQAQGVVIIPISIDKAEQSEKARLKLKELSNGTLDFYSDPKMDLPFPLLVKGFPTTIIYDANNQEIARIPSTPKWDGPEAEKLMQAILAQ